MLTGLVCMLGHDRGVFVSYTSRYEGWPGYFVTFSDHLEKKVSFVLVVVVVLLHTMVVKGS